MSNLVDEVTTLLQNRITSLDSIRGLAALSVVFHHCLLTIPVFYAVTTFKPAALTPIRYIITRTPLHMIWDGHAAVVLFFVLSGFVLSLPTLSGKRQTYVQFVIKRFFRVYIPYIVVICISGLLVTIRLNDHIQTHTGLSWWFYQMWSLPVNKQTFFPFFWMNGQYNNQFDTATWSLVHEMRISLVFPLIVWLVKRTQWYVSALLALVFLTIGAHLFEHGLLTEYRGLYLLNLTVYYTSFFVIGATFAKYRENVTDYIKRSTRAKKVMFLALSVLTYQWTWIAPISMSNSYFGQMPVGDLMIGIGSVIIIGLTLSSPRLQTALDRRPLQWLGKVSYSLYLIHVVVLLSMLYAFGDKLPLHIELLMVPFLSLIAAWMIYHSVESPSISLGQRTSAFAKRLRITTLLTKAGKASTSL